MILKTQSRKNPNNPETVYHPVRFSKFASATRQRNNLLCTADTWNESFHLLMHTGCVDFTIKMMFFFAVCFHFNLINIHILIIWTLNYLDYLLRSQRVRIIQGSTVYIGYTKITQSVGLLIIFILWAYNHFKVKQKSL